MLTIFLQLFLGAADETSHDNLWNVQLHPASHFPFMQSSWCSTDRVSTRFFVSPVYSPHYQNLIHKHWGNSVVTPG